MTRLFGSRRHIALLLPWVALWFLRLDAAGVFDQRHPTYQRVLSGAVTAEGVNYGRLKASPADLDAYLDELASMDESTFAAWDRKDRLALLLNLYNATTLRVVRDHFPIRSIRNIGLLPGAAWREPSVRFAGKTFSLDHLEHKVIRADYSEPRIHFALVCAARGCPQLRLEPYRGADLDRQLDEQARQFLGTPAKNRFDASQGVLWLSPIFDWYSKDFTTAAGTLPRYVQPFLPSGMAAALGAAGEVRVRYTEYDWDLNNIGQ